MSETVKLPKRVSRKTIDLNIYDPSGHTYKLLLQHCATLWPALNLVQEFSHTPGLAFVSSSVAREVPYVRKDGIRYGCTANKRTQVDSLALITQSLDSQFRYPVEIINFFVVQVPNSGLPAHVCALVRRLLSDDDIPHFLWDL